MKYKKGFLYQLDEDEQYQWDILPLELVAETRWLLLDGDGLLTVRAGYSWDGPSGPVIHTPENMRASLIHDAHYQFIRLGLVHFMYRAAADRLYKHICIESGMSQARAESHYIALRLFGGAAALVESEPVVLFAP